MRHVGTSKRCCRDRNLWPYHPDTRKVTRNQPTTSTVDETGLFDLADVPTVTRRNRGKIPTRAAVGLAGGADAQPDAGRYRRVDGHLLRVALSDMEGNELDRHTAGCLSCNWTQEDFEDGYEERRAWVEAFKHAGLNWEGRRVLIEPPFSQNGKGNAAYLARIEKHFGDFQGPYLLITQNCQEGVGGADSDSVGHNCIGVIHGRGDGEADDRIGLCVDACHDAPLGLDAGALKTKAPNTSHQRVAVEPSPEEATTRTFEVARGNEVQAGWDF